MAVSRKALARGREALPGEILQKIDSGDRVGMVIKKEAWSGVRSFSGSVPFWHLDTLRFSTADAVDPAAEPRPVVELERMRLKISRRRAPMPYTYRSTTRDEVHFVHTGRARFLTELGEIEGVPGRFVFIGRGVSYRVVPHGEDFFDLILESEEPIEASEHWATCQLSVVQPRFPFDAGATNGPWVERILGEDWSATVERDYDPVASMEVVGDHDLVFAIDIKDIPAEVPGTHRPFRLFTHPLLDWDISKQGAGEGPPFHHRNNVRNEIHFVHHGDADQVTELGYIDAPAGTLFCMPFGVEHTFGQRDTPPATLLMETRGKVRLIDPDVS
jgi:mannose-6-phosphate isomerase-like protein (cupin superfamily)